MYVDVASGAKASRPKLDLVMQLLREGDTLKVTRLDRLSRSVLHLVTLGVELRERGIGLHVIEQGIDTATMEGRAMFGMLSVLAELQRELIVANTNDGLASARARGRVGRRAPAQAHPRPGRARASLLARPSRAASPAARDVSTSAGRSDRGPARSADGALVVAALKSVFVPAGLFGSRFRCCARSRWFRG
ncbi:recombinase family protein [Streptomyces sp. NPDC001816]|uniref:recombinase family protein n=1 Tax=Streptomyces sp. NPDC001816 TaxID=3364612 RepID=UPI00368E1BC0